MPWTRFIVAAMVLALLPASIGAQPRRRVAVPRAIVEQILRDSANEMIRRTLDSLAANLVAEPVDLNGDGVSELIVRGIHSVCGANNCLVWIYRREGATDEPLLAVGTVQQIEARSYLDARGRFHELTRPRITPIECAPAQ